MLLPLLVLFIFIFMMFFGVILLLYGNCIVQLQRIMLEKENRDIYK